MASLEALEKAAKDAAALVPVKEKAYKDAVPPADTAKRAKDAKKAVKNTEKSKLDAAKEEAKKVEDAGKAAVAKAADEGKAAVAKANEARDATKKVNDADNKEVDRLLGIAKTETTNATNAANASANAIKAANAARSAATTQPGYAANLKKAEDAVKATNEKKKAAEAARDKAQDNHKAAVKKAEGSKATYDKAAAAAKAAADSAAAANKAAVDKAAAANKAAADKVKAANDAYNRASNEASAASKEWSAKIDTKWNAYNAFRDADKAARAAGDAWADAARKAGIAQKVIDTTAASAKLIIGGVTGVFQTALSAVANISLLKGTKVGTAVDLSNCLVGKATSSLLDFAKDIGIDTAAGLASAIYCGKTVGQVTDAVVSAAKNSAKSNWTDICDKTMALLQAYDPDLTAEDLKDFVRGLKESVKAKMG